MLKKIFVTSAFLLTLFSFAKAQYLVEHFTTDNGLPQNSVKKIHLDDVGFLWIATEDGLVRYNGQSFTVYNKTNLPYITQNRFTALHYTSDSKKIYAINVEGYAFKIQDGKIDITNSQKKCDSLHLPLLNEIHARYWVKAYGPAYKDIQNAIPTGYLDSKSFPYTDTSFSIYSDGNVRLYSRNRLLKTLAIPNGLVPYKFFNLGKKHFFITKNAKIFALNYDDNKIIKVEVAGAYTHLMETLDTKSFDAYKNWYTKNAYLQNKDLLYKLSINETTDKLTLEYITNNVPLNDEKTFDISEDESTIFLGTTTEGLFILKKNSFDALIPQGPLLNEYSFYGLIPYNKNSVLTSNGYLLNDDKSHKRIFTSNDDNRYITKFNDIIYFTKNHKICKLINGFTTEITLPNWLTRPGAFLNDQHNEFIWVAYEKGIAKINKNDVIEKVFTSDLIDTTANSPIYCLLQDSLHNNLYVGTSNGIFKFNYKNKSSESTKALLGKRVRALNLINNILFVGTEGDGYYTIYNGRVYKMPLDDNNNLSSVHCFVKDKLNRIWMPSNKGLFMATFESIFEYINNKNKPIYYFYFDKKNGITNSEFNGGCQPCAAILKDETILLPSIQGVIAFNPKQINPAFYSTTILFEKIIADSTYTTINKLVFKGNLSQYKFYWSSPAWNAEEKNSFEFNVLGLDTNWKKIEIEDPIILSNLNKGNYTLQIRKIIPDGNYITKQLPFKILPKWYETILFYVVVGIAILGLFLLLIRLNAKKIIKKNIHLEKVVKNRTEELSNANNKLLSEIELKNKIVAIISHDMITPLNYSSQVTEGLLTNRNTIEKSELLHSIEVLNTTNSSLYLMALNTLKLINNNKISPVYEKFDLHELIKEKISLYKIAEQKKLLKFLNHIPENTQINSDQNLLGLAIQNIINNAVKFTPTGSIIIEGQAIKPNKYQISIKDTGIGMKEEILKKLRGSTNNIVDYNTNQKMGWLIITDILQILGATYEIESKENVGTQITIIL